MLFEIYTLDLIGTFAFASYGSYLAIKNNFDLFGISVCAFLTALGGGTIREIVLKNTPFYLFDDAYIFTIIAAVIFSVVVFKRFEKIRRLVLVLDAVGLVTFAFIGAAKAAQADLGILAITILATVNAVAGGVLRDIVMNTVPEIMYRNFYASVAVLLGLSYGLLGSIMNSVLWANILLGTFFLVRIWAVYFNVSLWKPDTTIKR